MNFPEIASTLNATVPWIKSHIPETSALVMSFFSLCISWRGYRVAKQQKEDADKPIFTIESLRSLKFINSGTGNAFQVTADIWIQESVTDWFPRFAHKHKRWLNIPAQGKVVLPLGLVADEFRSPSGGVAYSNMQAFELQFRYLDIRSKRYLAHFSIGANFEVRSARFGSRARLWRRAWIWLGIFWRYYKDHIPIWWKVRNKRDPVL